MIITEVPSWLALSQENFNFWVLWFLESRLVGITITCLQNSRYADVKNPFCKPFVFLQNVWILLYLPLARVLVAKRELMLYKRKSNPFLSVFWRRLADIKVLRINTEQLVVPCSICWCDNVSKRECIFFTSQNMDIVPAVPDELGMYFRLKKFYWFNSSYLRMCMYLRVREYFYIWFSQDVFRVLRKQKC